ncbi:cilia- and flagella-associated protein 46 isoform X3 [Etheostoma cragini]|uniref:cilia- and flagella-associated protein 46 isoform X3 n=1 Tax=Etheostoma cragini TaxID=417921 RepID=UPI00155E1356|nr:cilia- and flagella-associated protein 46 isoform X3 [Etheostoma cragini]
MDQDIRQYLTKAKERQDSGALQSAYQLIKDGMEVAGTSGRPPCIAPELYVVCAEAALQLGCLEISTACLKMYFEGNPPANQFLCRAYLCQGQLKSPSATGSVEDFEEAVLYFLKAIEISKHEPRYHFIVFNASVLYFQSVCLLLQPGRCLHLVPSLRQVVQSLEDVADQDHSWRAELMMHLIKCLMDSGKKDEAASFAKVTEEFIRSHTPHLFPRHFTILVQHNLTEKGVLIEMSRQSTTLAVIYKIQEVKNLEDINEDELTKEKLEQIFQLLMDCTKASTMPVNSSPLQCPTPIQPADRVAFLLELALLALQVKHKELADDCLKELKSLGEASIGQRIIMDCINCENNLLKKEAKMNDYSKSSVEARLKDIGKLDQWLQTAVREGDPQALQAVCATQWSICLPLLQHNLRKRIKTPLLRVAQVLEDMQSTLLEMRCQVHSELAVIEEEDGRLEASLTHLQKAMMLDNGTQRERLSSAFRLLQLRGTLYQTPSRTKDKAAMLMQQARDMLPQDRTNIRPILVAVGLLLAPDDFQMVVDADNTSKIPVGSRGSGPVAQLSAKAQHHSASVQKVDGHLARQGDDTDNTESMMLWATLVKTARKLEVWDVCRAACRFCLLYDDGRWRISKTDNPECGCKEEESCAKCLDSCNGSQTCVRDLLRLLAEICFISAEATVQKLLTEGVQLNSPVVPAVESELCLSEEDPHWVVYRDWIQALSAYGTSNFLRAAELGVEIREPWLVANAAIYLWNYSSHLLAAGEYQCLLPTFQSLVAMLQKTEFTGNRAFFVLLCDAVARGLIQPLCRPDSTELAPPGDKDINKPKKGMEKASAFSGVLLDPDALQDLHKASELCDYALRISNIPGETVPIAARKQVVATWVQIKRLMQQQIGSKMDTNDESENDEVSVMTRVLVGVEMLQCNRNPRHMEFFVPSLSTLVSMASECSWTDAVVKLHVLCQLAAFCHNAKNHSLVLCCTKNALQLEEAAAKSLNTMPCVLYGLTAVNEMLSSACCLRGLSLVQESNGDLHTYREALRVLLSSVSYAEKAENPAMCVTAARHYWNTCLPLTQTPEDRWQLQESLEKILFALVHTNTKNANKQGRVKNLLTLTALPLKGSKHEATDEEYLILKAAIYSLLLHNHIDKSAWKGALQLLDQAIRDMPITRHRLPLLKHRILVKARLGENVLTDMEMLQEEGEQCCSFMWHQVALCAGSLTQQLTCYQKSITSLLNVETQWQKVNLLLEFGEWLYCHNFPKDNAQHQVQWAIDILLHLETEHAEGAEDNSKKMDFSSVKCESLVGVQGSLFTQSLSNLKEVRHLDSLVRAHTLLAVMADKTSPEYQLNLLRAYSFVLQIWKVSMAVACEISNEMAKSQPPQPPPSGGSKKDKDKGKKVKDPPPSEERPKPVSLDLTIPSSPKNWARYVCPDQARQIFRSNINLHCINTQSIPKQTQSLFYLNLLEKELHSLSLDHLTLPIMHLAETFANDLLDRRSLSDLYRLRIVRTCCQLGLETHSPYQEKLLNLSRIQEQERMGCRKAIAVLQERRGLLKAYNQKGKVDEKAASGQQSMDVSAQDIWLDKAEVCLSMGLFQPARQLLAEAHFVAMELGDQKAMARSLLSLAILACEEEDNAQALNLLDKAQALGGDEEFWYQLTLTKVRAVVGQRDEDAHTKADQIIKQGIDALKLVLEQRVNRVPGITFLITSLEMRGAIECIRSVTGGEPGGPLSTEVVERIMAACDTLRECANGFTKLNYREHAAEAHVEFAHGLRILANHSTYTEDKQRFLLDGLSQMQLGVTEQEHVALNAQRLLTSQEESHGLSLEAMRRLLRLRVALAEFWLAVLEEHCAEEKRQALARERKTSAEIALEEYTRCTPEPNSLKQEWVSVVSTLGQVALGQLAAVSSHSLDNMETRACCLSLMGKYLRLLAVQEDPIYLCALWDRHKQKEAWAYPKAINVEEENSEKEKNRESSRREPRVTSAKSAELQKGRRRRAQQLLARASNALAEAINLCLQHKLPSSILADASLNMLECHGQSDPALAGQYIALFQSCCTAAMMAEVLRSACAGTRVSQLSALLSLHRKLLLSQEERPSSMLKGVEDSLNSLSKGFSHLTISPSHLNILAELPPNLKILLLQHSEDGSELYGAFYETTKVPNQKGKTTQVTGTLTCSRVAKVSVYPQALLALREQTRTFGQETRHALLKQACWHSAEGRLEASEEHHVFPCNTAAEKMLGPQFREIVQEMEDYLKPLLTQFDFSCLRNQAASLPVPEMNKTKEEKGSSDKLPPEPGEYVILLADKKLLELPLEALSILQDESLSSVSRDFSLQLLHSRLNRAEPDKVESDNKKETKGGKGTKGKGDQSQAIKVNHVLPSNTFPVDIRKFKYVVDPHNEGNFEGTSLCTRMEEILETHSQHFTHLWEGFMGSKQTPSLSEVEQLLCRCSAFIYLGMERFIANIPPAKLAALNLSDCHMALIFDLVQNSASVLRQSNLDLHKSEGQLDLEKPLETALLLSMGGVGCIALKQWHSSLQQNTHIMANVLDNLLRVRQTSGHTIHALRREDSSEKPHHMVSYHTGSYDQVLLTDSKEDDVHHETTLTPSAFNCILYGLPNLTVM